MMPDDLPLGQVLEIGHGERWWHRMARACAEAGRMRVIPDRDDPTLPYLLRFYPLFRQASWFQGFNVVLHRVLLSDSAELHDHPWWSVSIILAGGYVEHLPNGVAKRRRPGDIVMRRATALHRIELDPAAGEVWTLFLMGPRLRVWGFVTACGWVPWDRYLRHRAPSTTSKES